MLRPLLLRFFRALSGVYFRDIEVVGAPASDTRGRLFAANHVNGLIDPILVVTSAPFPIAPVAKAPLFKVPILRTLLRIADAVPVVRKQEGGDASANEAVFDRIADHFGRGGNVLIFPEGVSHNEPQLAPLKTGPARMLARAHERGVRGLTFQTVALEFDARDTFRSRALVMFGPVREADGDVARMTEQLREDLTELVVEGRTWPERRLIARVAEILTHDSGDRSLAGWSSIGRQVEAARRVLDDPTAPLYRDVEGAVSHYYDLLARTGAREDHLIAGVPRRPGALLRALWLLAIFPLAALGMLSHALPYQLPRLAPRLAGKEQDVVSTYKLGLGIAAHGLWIVASIIAACLFLTGWLRVLAIVLVVLAPFAALTWLDRSEVLFARWAARRHRHDLRRARANAVSAIERAREVVNAAATSSGTSQVASPNRT
jgi:1-acyl-sn-glycerol-3-phosphate acyltransferase